MKSIIKIVLLLMLINPVNIYGQSRPFPQNVNYPNGYKATVISTNVLQNAYNRWKALFLKSCNGMLRVCNEDTSVTISEGMGYGMLLTAYFGEKEYFDGLLEFYKSKITATAFNLMGWRVTCDGIGDPGSATDGDLDVAFALIVAHYQWGEDYLDEAKEIISILKEHYFVDCSGINTMKPGGQFGGCGLTDISYYSPAYFHLFAQVTDDPFWNTVAEDSYTILLNGANDSTGLVPDWQSYDGIPGGNPPSGRIDYYRYDASRTPWRMALDYIWNANADAQDWCIKITNFANSIGASNIRDGYNLNGTVRGQYNNSAFVGGFAVGSMCNSQTIVNSFAQRLLSLDGSGGDNQYFNLSLRCIYMLVLTGNFWQPGTVPAEVEPTKPSPKEFNLLENFPNPFNPSTTIKYSILKPSYVKISVYDLLGQEIRILKSGFQNAGEYSIVWNATDDLNNSISSSVYFYRLSLFTPSGETEGQILQKKMVLVR